MSKVTGLSYLGIEASDLPAWRRFAAECLGMEVSGDDALTVRFDDTWQVKTHDQMSLWGHRAPTSA